MAVITGETHASTELEIDWLRLWYPVANITHTTERE